ncbi:hypothetical protein [Amycolatopsis jejuensis]|uniref:hypothetical protein n=1 Tax=Amycolatopsis jejuensis TaxID=330084 RepID=UPI0012E0323D|nr:hypothetical protein [Amycolatopsis jejuensis]
MSSWTLVLVCYVAIAFVSFTPTAVTICRKGKLLSGKPSFEASIHFSDLAKTRLMQHEERIRGALTYWKSRAEKAQSFQHYCLVWVTLSTALVPFLSQAVTSDPTSKWTVTIIGAHGFILLALARTFRVEENHKSFRNGESEYLDLRRRMLDDPTSFGLDEEEQLQSYFRLSAAIRRSVRNAETRNYPSVDKGPGHGTPGSAQ